MNSMRLFLICFALCACQEASIDSDAPNENSVTLCQDGKDNDFDGDVDCDDTECKGFSVCASGADGGPDGGDRGVPDLTGDLQSGPQDLSTPDMALSPDMKLSNLGDKCSASAPCLGTLFCGYFPGNAKAGYCTKVCSTLNASCSGVPAGTSATCAMQVNTPTGTKLFCIFECSSSQACPTQLTCDTSIGYCKP